MFEPLMDGLSAVLTVQSLIYLLLGSVIGIVVGIFPGLGPSAGIAILLPLTFGMDPLPAVVMLAAIYYGAMYGATITSIMLNVPGAGSVVASTFDGFPLAQNGRVGPALVMQAFASFVGGTVGVILLTLITPLFSRVTRSFGPPEFFMVIMMGMMALIVLVGKNRRLGLISALIGFALATVGLDSATGFPRFTFGSPQLTTGIDFVPVAIGLFGIGEVFYSLYNRLHVGAAGIARVDMKEKNFWPTKKDFSESKFTFARGSFLGFVIGLIPGAGATIASLVSYSVEKSVAKDPEKFGKGEMRGLTAPETANNAASAGAMIPLLTLGIPGSASTAVLLAAFLMWGLRPGPLLMTQEPTFAWGLIGSMYLGNMMLVLLCIFAIPLFVKLVQVPYRVIAPVVIVLCAVGTFSINGNLIDVWIMLTAGLVGFFMKRFNFSPAATVIALVLGPLAEASLRQSLIISRGSPLIFVERPTSLIIALIGIGIAGLSPVLKRARSVKPSTAPDSIRS